MKKCRYCDAELQSTAITCKVCGRLQKRFLVILTQIIVVLLLLMYSIYMSVIVGKSISNGENWNKFYLASRKRINSITHTVDLTVPKEFIEILGDDFNYKLTKEQKDKGFTKITTNAAGDVVFVISEEDYQVFIQDLKKTTKQSLKEQIEELNGSSTSIQIVKYSPNLDEIKVYVDKEEYSYGLDSINISFFALTAYIYQIYDVDSAKTVKVEIINYKTDSKIEEYNYPENKE